MFLLLLSFSHNEGWMDSFVILSQQGAWIDPELLREASCEVFGVVKSYLECYLRDVHVAGDAVLENELVGKFQTVCADQLVRTLSHQAL